MSKARSREAIKTLKELKEDKEALKQARKLTKDTTASDVIRKAELLDFVIQLEIAFNKKGDISKGEVADILEDMKVKWKKEATLATKERILDKLCNRDFIMSILRDCVTIDIEENMKFIYTEDVINKFKQAINSSEVSK